MIICSKKDCLDPGTQIPVLFIRKNKNDRPLTAVLEEVRRCHRHKTNAQIAEFLSPEGWDKLQRHLRELGRGRYVLKLTTLSWQEDEAALRKAETYFRNGPILKADSQQQIADSQGDEECLPF